MKNYKQQGIIQRFKDAWNILIGARHLELGVYSKDSGPAPDTNRCYACSVHEEYELYLRHHIESLELRIKQFTYVPDISVPLSDDIEPMKPITSGRRSFKDIQRELEVKHKIQTKEQVIQN